MDQDQPSQAPEYNQSDRPFQSPEPEQPIQPPQSSDGSGRRFKGSKRLVALVILLLAVGAVGAYVLLGRVKAPSNSGTTQQPAAQSGSTKIPDSDYVTYQVGKTLLAYDLDTKKTVQLTDVLPDNARALSVFASDDTWRSYYETPTASGGSEYWYAAKNEKPVKLASTKNFTAAFADADSKQLVYSEVFSIEENATAEERTIRTYQVTDKETKRIWQSESQTANSTGYKKPNYVVAGVSPDGKRVLFNYVRLYSDGGSPVDAFELEVASGKTTPVYKGTVLGGIRYANKAHAYIVTETDDAGLGSFPPGDVAVYKLKEPGGSQQVMTKLSNASWSYVATSADVSLAYGSNYDEQAGLSSLVGVYAITGSDTNQIQQLTLSGFPEGHIVLGFTSQRDGCLGATLSKYDNKEQTTSYDVGVVCVNDKTATYTSVKQLKVLPSASTTNVQVFDNLAR